jgi:tRNA-modifying protein YgfZ
VQTERSTDEDHRDLIEVDGEDAVTYLQGQLSQDISGLVVDQPAWSLLLEPTGKMGAWVRVTRRADPDGFRIDVDEGSGAAVLARLERFKLRSRLELRLVPGAGDPPDGAAEAARIEAGVPRMGAEITEDVIPAELGQWLIHDSVSFTKGCYTGQELVARIDSRGGNVPRHLRGLVLAGDQVPPVGSEVLVDDAVVGTVTSAAHSPDRGAPVALAFIARKVDPPATGAVRIGSELVAAQIRALPLEG